MIVKENCSLLLYNTFGLDVKAKCFVEYESKEELLSFLSSLAGNERLLHIGQGSNLLFMRSSFDGTILHSAIKGITLKRETDDAVYVQVEAGEIWDDFVSYCVAHHWGGAENLSLIPGTVGASAVQNIGAYGAEVKDIIEEVYAIEKATGKEKVFTNEECQYSYRHSIFKSEFRDTYIIMAVLFRLSKRPQLNLSYHNILSLFAEGEEITLGKVREQIIKIRESKLPNPKYMGNAGSFFMNPIIPLEKLTLLQQEYPSIPYYDAGGDRRKIPAAWLIEQSGWKGKSYFGAGVYNKQPLVLVNKGGAKSMDIIILAQKIIDSILQKFGIELKPEVIYID